MRYHNMEVIKKKKIVDWLAEWLFMVVSNFIYNN